jgi:hypothetical protein
MGKFLKSGPYGPPIRPNPFPNSAQPLSGAPNLVGALPSPSPIGRIPTLFQAANFHFQNSVTSLCFCHVFAGWVSPDVMDGSSTVCQRAVPTSNVDPQGILGMPRWFLLELRTIRDKERDLQPRR